MRRSSFRMGRCWKWSTSTYATSIFKNSKCWKHLSYFFLLPKILKLFGFPIVWLWVYLMKVITETCRVHYHWYLRFYYHQDKDIVVPADNAPINIVFVCYIILHWLLSKWDRHWHFTWQPYIYTYHKYVLSTFQPKMKKWIFSLLYTQVR